MKIVFVAPRFHTNQTEVARVLLSKGHSIEFHCLMEGATENHSILKPKIWDQCSLSLWVQQALGGGGAGLTRAFPAPLKYLRYIRRARPDLFVVRDPSRAFSILASICARLVGAKVIFYNQEPLFNEKPLVRRLLEGAVLWSFDAAHITPIIGSPDSGVKNTTRSFFVPFAVPVYRAARKVARRSPVVIMVGKYNARKRHEFLVSALTNVSSNLRFRALLVGECVTPEQLKKFEELTIMIKKAGLSHRVRLLRNIEHERMSRLYQMGDLFVLPSIDEPASVSVLEAIGSGLPAISSDSNGTQYYIEAGVTGGIFPAADRLELERLILQFLGEPGKLMAMKESCILSATEYFSGEAYYRRFRAVISGRWPGRFPHEGAEATLEAWEGGENLKPRC
ncbi:GT4_PimA-like domain containing protein [Caulobacteraceae bacterium]